MTMDPLRRKKRKGKEKRRRGKDERSEIERATDASDAGKERKSGNDESIVPVQRLFCEPSRRSVYLLQLCQVCHNRSHRHLSDSSTSISLAKTTMKSDCLWTLWQSRGSREDCQGFSASSNENLHEFCQFILGNLRKISCLRERERERYYNCVKK